jgi:DNA-binding NtrC family response regulator
MNDNSRIRFLIVDNEPTTRELCLRIGESLGYACSEAESAEAALTLLVTDYPDVVVSDLSLPQQSGVELLGRIKSEWPRAEVAIMTGRGCTSSAVEAMKLGAYDYITKPFSVEEMKLILQRMAEKIRLLAERDRLRDRVRELENGIARVAAPGIENSLGAGMPTFLSSSYSSAASGPLASQGPTDLEHLERITIERVFHQVRGDKVLAGKMLGISRATLYRKLKRYNIGIVARAAASGNL